MTPQEFKEARRTLGLSASKLAQALKVSDGRTIRRWEAGDRDIPGPAIVAINFMLKAKRKSPNPIRRAGS